jgi:hypothetical protein
LEHAILIAWPNHWIKEQADICHRLDEYQQHPSTTTGYWLRDTNTGLFQDTLGELYTR